MEDTSGDTTGLLRQRKAKQVLDLIWEEDHELLPLFEKTESFPERIMASAVNIIRSNLAALNRHVREFGKWDSITNLEEVDLSATLRKSMRLIPFTSSSMRQRINGHEDLRMYLITGLQALPLFLVLDEQGIQGTFS